MWWCGGENLQEMRETSGMEVRAWQRVVALRKKNTKKSVWPCGEWNLNLAS